MTYELDSDGHLYLEPGSDPFEYDECSPHVAKLNPGREDYEQHSLLILNAPRMLEELENIQANLTGRDYRPERIADSLRRATEIINLVRPHATKANA